MLFVVEESHVSKHLEFVHHVAPVDVQAVNVVDVIFVLLILAQPLLSVELSSELLSCGRGCSPAVLVFGTLASRRKAMGLKLTGSVAVRPVS